MNLELGLGISAAIRWAFLCRPSKQNIFSKNPSNLGSEKELELPSKKKVSVIIPARNEEENLKKLLAGIKNWGQSVSEVIVVNDSSEDNTAAVASQMGARVIHTTLRNPKWGGKNWACWQGAQAASGDYLLFTDADVELFPNSVDIAVMHLDSSSSDMLSACPRHENPALWERLLGPFHVALGGVTNFLGEPKAKRLFAIGQFLLFKRSSYFNINGHESVHNILVEDSALARKIIEKNLKYTLFTRPLFIVRMYSTFSDFIQGWIRNFRTELPKSHWSAFIDIFGLYFLLSLSLGTLLTTPQIYLATATGFGFAQQRWGHFSLLGALFFPIGLIVFAFVSAVAVISNVTNKPLIWKGRSYPRSVS